MQKYNCYSILSSLRHSLNEHSDAYVQGTDTSGKYSNTYLVEQINEAYRGIFAFLALRLPHYFQEEVSITGVDSVFTLPADYGALKQFRDAEGNMVYPIGWNDRKNVATAGSEYEYYRSGNTLVLNKPGITQTFTLYYKKRCRDLKTALAGANSIATKLHITGGVKTDDTYNGFYVENVTQDLAEEITDYAGSTQLATVASTPLVTDYFGFVPEIPEPFQHMIKKRAAMLVRSDFPLAQQVNSQETYQEWQDEMADLLRVYGDLQGDIPVEEDFEDFEDFGDE